MYNHATIIECLRGLVGFEYTYNSENDSIDSALLSSSSGIYVNNLHPLLTWENILAISEQFSKTSVRSWSSTVTYKKYDIVKGSSTIYYSLVDGNLNHVVTDATKWQATSLLSAFLRRLYDASVVKLFSQLFTEKKLNEVAKSLLGQVSLFEGVGNISGRITKNNRMVGYKIRVKHPDTIATLSHIGLQLDTVQSDVKIYLYHTSSNQPVQTFTINHTKSIQFQWHEITAEVFNYLSSSINAGGAYYLTYYESELTGSAIKKDYNFTGRSNCGTCTESIVNNRLYNQWSRFVSIQPFYVNSDNLPKDGENLTHELWDEDREIYIDDSTWGINLQLSVQCDVSDLMCRNKSVLATALSQQLVVDMLNAMAYSLRDNQKKERIAGLAAVALDNTENHQAGELKKLKNAITALSFDFSSMSDACLPCNSTAVGIRRKTVWG